MQPYEAAHKAEFDEYRRQVSALGLDRRTSTGAIQRKRKTSSTSSSSSSSPSSPSSAMAHDVTADNEPEAASAVASASEA
jgi:hypothetical protein